MSEWDCGGVTRDCGCQWDCVVSGGYQKWTGREGDVGSQDGRLWNVMKRLWVTEGDCGVSGGVVWCQEGAVGCQEVWVSEGDCGVSGRDCGVPGGEYGVS